MIIGRDLVHFMPTWRSCIQTRLLIYKKYFSCLGLTGLILVVTAYELFTLRKVQCQWQFPSNSFSESSKNDHTPRNYRLHSRALQY